MKTGTSDELRLVLSILEKMEAESEHAQKAREIALTDLRHLVKIMSEGKPVVKSAEVIFEAGSSVKVSAGGRFQQFSAEE